ncbi:Hypothetical protein NocV09_00103420 [Nannochloropsis oceanica]
MAKSARSKTRKHWASERRRTLGVPAETKQLKEQAERLAASLSTQTDQPSIMKLRGILRRLPGSEAQAMSVQRRMAINNKTKKSSSNKKEAVAKKASEEDVEMPPAAEESEEEEEEEEAEGMEVVPGKRATGKARVMSRFKKSGQAYSAKKQKRVKL